MIRPLVTIPGTTDLQFNDLKYRRDFDASHPCGKAPASNCDGCHVAVNTSPREPSAYVQQDTVFNVKCHGRVYVIKANGSL
jgi:hypothetical protein